MAGYIGKITAGGTTRPIAHTLYGTCSTAASTAAKVVACSDFDTLVTGVTIAVKFTNANTASSPTLNVNSTGAKNIYRYGTTAPSTSAATSWNAGAVVLFVYDGSYWQMTNWMNQDTTTVSLTSSNVTGTLPVSHGGTGVTSQSALNYNFLAKDWGITATSSNSNFTINAYAIGGWSQSGSTYYANGYVTAFINGYNSGNSFSVGGYSSQTKIGTINYGHPPTDVYTTMATDVPGQGIMTRITSSGAVYVLNTWPSTTISMTICRGAIAYPVQNISW